jgi:hypothetical protein
MASDRKPRLTEAKQKEFERLMLDDLDLYTEEEDARVGQPTEEQLDMYEQATRGEY